MISPRARQRFQKQVKEQLAARQSTYTATLMAVNGSVTVPGNKHLCYVADPRRKVPYIVRNVRTPHIAGYRVMVGMDPMDDGRLQVLGAKSAGWSEINNPAVGPHADSHTWGGSDIVFSDTKQIIQLNVFAKGGMVIGVRAGVITTPIGAIRAGTTSMTLTAPVTGVRIDLIQANLTTGVVSVKAGTGFDLSEYSYAKIPPADSGCIALAAVRLYAGQTAISNNFTDPDIIDLRFLSIGFGGGTIAALYHNYVLLYHAGTITAYDPTALGLKAALAASTYGDTITAPPFMYIDDFTVPAGVTVIGYGNETVLYGTVTMGDEAWLQNLKVVSVSEDATTAIAIEGPASGIALLWHVSVQAANTSTGDAICIHLNGGGVTVQTGTLRAQYTDAAAHSWIVYSSGSENVGLQFAAMMGTDSLADPAPANWLIAAGATADLYGCLWHNGYTPASGVTYVDDGDRSPIDHTHANPDYPGLDTVALFHSGTVTTYSADATGLAAALLAGSTPGDIIVAPPMDFTGDFTVQAGAMLVGYGNVTRILGKVTLGNGSWLQSIKVQNIGSSSDPIVGIVGPGVGNSALGWFAHIYVANTGTGDAYAVDLNGGTVTLRNGTARAQHTDGSAKSRIFYEATPTSDTRGWVDYMALLGTALLTDAAPTSWAISEGAITGVSNCEWHAGHEPASGVSYASGDRSPINHTHVEADITDLKSYSETGHQHVEADITDLDHTDTDAIHDNESGEIAALTEKSPVVGDDLVLIEDSAATNAKKKAKLSSLNVHTHVEADITDLVHEIGVYGDGVSVGDYEELDFKGVALTTDSGNPQRVEVWAKKAYNGFVVNEDGGDTSDDDFRVEGNTEDKLMHVIAADDLVRLGDSDTNYTQWDKTGHQTMVGNARPWRDELGELLGKKKLGARITDNLPEGTVDFSDSCQIADDYIITNVQLNHDKDLTASLYPHIHWFQASADVPNWLLQYRWQINGGAKVTAWTNLKCNTTAFTWSSGTITQICYSAAISVPVGTALSDIVQFRICRDTDNDSTVFSGSDPLSGNASALMFDVHFQINSMGSDNEYAK